MKQSALMRTVLSCLLMIVSGCSRGERIEFQYHELVEITDVEFMRLFHPEVLYAKCCWYYGAKNGMHYLEIDIDESVDEHDDMFNRRVRHQLYRYRVSNRNVQFSKSSEFMGFNAGHMRIVKAQHEDAESISYSVLP